MKKMNVDMKNMNMKKILIFAALILVFANVIWTLTQSSVNSKFGEVQASLQQMEERVKKLENGGLSDVDALQEKFKSLQEISQGYDAHLAQLVKAEEEKLASLQAQLEAQKTRVDSLKKLVPEGK